MAEKESRQVKEELLVWGATGVYPNAQKQLLATRLPGEEVAPCGHRVHPSPPAVTGLPKNPGSEVVIYYIGLESTTNHFEIW